MFLEGGFVGAGLGGGFLSSGGCGALRDEGGGFGGDGAEDAFWGC